MSRWWCNHEMKSYLAQHDQYAWKDTQYGKHFKALLSFLEAASVTLTAAMFFSLELLPMWSRRWRCQRASVQEAPSYFLNWTWAVQSEASDVKLSDYQELHSDDWHHYTDCIPSRLILQSRTRHTSAKWVIVPQRHEACVWERACECVFCPLGSWVLKGKDKL